MTGWTAAWLLAAVVAGMGVQAVLTLRQGRAFTAATRQLREHGAVAIGQGGRRYRGGRAYVALASDPAGVVTEAIVLRGWTTFARAEPLPAVRGKRLSRLAGSGDLPPLRPNEREAAREAAQVLRASLGVTRR